MNKVLKLSSIVDTDLFYKEIDKLVKNHNLSYMDAVIHYCEKTGMEIETAAQLVKGNFRMKSHLREEGETLNMIERAGRLPL